MNVLDGRVRPPLQRSRVAAGGARGGPWFLAMTTVLVYSTNIIKSAPEPDSSSLANFDIERHDGLALGNSLRPRGGIGRPR